MKMARHYLEPPEFENPLTWAPNPEPLEKMVIRTYKAPPTPAEDVWKQVQQWYHDRGQPIPAEEAIACRKEIVAEKAAMKASAEALEVAKVEAAAAPTKPLFGSGEYWKDYWAKKRAAGWVPKKDKKV